MKTSDLTEQQWLMHLRAVVAERIAQFFSESGVSQAEFARRIGVPQPTLSLVVRGRVGRLSLELLLRMCARSGRRYELTIDEAADPVPDQWAPLDNPKIDPETGGTYSRLASEMRESRRCFEAALTPEQRIELFIQQQAVAEIVSKSAKRERP
jgi:predicted XRE-type DNA-binding protein